jgi:hypothetical protein
LNQETCIISSSPNACAVGSSYQNDMAGPKFLVPLNETIIRVLYQESGFGRGWNYIPLCCGWTQS